MQVSHTGIEIVLYVADLDASIIPTLSVLLQLQRLGDFKKELKQDFLPKIKPKYQDGKYKELQFPSIAVFYTYMYVWQMYATWQFIRKGRHLSFILCTLSTLYLLQQ